jgi:hypothetical protein
LDVGSKEGKPDKIRALRVNNRELIVFGFLSSEFYVNTGDPDFPFKRIQGAFLEEGIAGKALHASLDHTVYWVARDKNGDKIIRRFDGYRGERISTFPIERWLNQQGDISSGTMWTYQQSGHSFLALNVSSTSGRTWFYDVAANLWCERDYTPNDGQAHTRHRAEGHVMVGSRHIVGDYLNGNIYELDESYYFDDVDATNPSLITKLRDTPQISNDDKWLTCSEVKLDMEMGVGPMVPLTDGAGNARAPMVMLQYSDDGGHRWSNEKTTSIGKLGEYKVQARWRRLGRFRRRMFRVKITDPVKVTLISGLGEVA